MLTSRCREKGNPLIPSTRLESPPATRTNLPDDAEDKDDSKQPTHTRPMTEDEFATLKQLTETVHEELCVAEYTSSH